MQFRAKPKPRPESKGLKYNAISYLRIIFFTVVLPDIMV